MKKPVRSSEAVSSKTSQPVQRNASILCCKAKNFVSSALSLEDTSPQQASGMTRTRTNGSLSSRALPNFALKAEASRFRWLRAIGSCYQRTAVTASSKRHPIRPPSGWLFMRRGLTTDLEGKPSPHTPGSSLTVTLCPHLARSYKNEGKVFARGATRPSRPLRGELAWVRKAVHLLNATRVRSCNFHRRAALKARRWLSCSCKNPPCPPAS